LTYANLVATLALVFAMSGGALAASKYLITSTKQISPKVLKALAGKPSKAGPAGPAGLQGPAGPAGANGKDGVSGVNGANGKDGANGASVTSASVPTNSLTCEKRGGSEFTAEGKKTTACNGKQGEPWTAGGTLPEGSSEHGQWIISAGSAGGFYETAISFPIPLKAALPEARTHRIGVEEGAKEPHESSAIKSGECSGTWKEPGAGSGNLCVFVDPSGSMSNLESVENAETEESGAGASGAIIGAGTGSSFFLLKGSWVVTG